MGVWVGVHDGGACLASERIGSAGSADVLCGVLFGGYAVGRNPDSRRAARWMTVDGSAPAGFPRDFLWTGRPKDLSAALAYGTDGCWVTVRDQAVERGWRQKPSACPMLTGLHKIWTVTRWDVSDGQIPPEWVGVCRDAIVVADAALAAVGCSWANKVRRVLAVFEAGANAGRPVSFSL